LIDKNYKNLSRRFFMVNDEVKKQHWAKTRNLTFLILAIWFVFSIIVPWNAASLNAFTFLGFPLGYYFCVQGSLIIFVALIFYQNYEQDKIDDEAGL
jgi:putative solute:sodium symporter small subunit